MWNEINSIAKINFLGRVEGEPGFPSIIEYVCSCPSSFYVNVL